MMTQTWQSKVKIYSKFCIQLQIIIKLGLSLMFIHKWMFYMHSWLYNLNLICLSQYYTLLEILCSNELEHSTGNWQTQVRIPPTWTVNLNFLKIFMKPPFLSIVALYKYILGKIFINVYQKTARSSNYRHSWNVLFLTFSLGKKFKLERNLSWQCFYEML